MKKYWITLLLMTLPLLVWADNHGAVEAEVLRLVKEFNKAYATNQVDDYFGFYASNASLYYFGERQSLEGYNKEWHEMVAAGGAVQRNDISDVEVKVLNGESIAVVTYFVDNQTRSAEGELTTARAFETDVWQKVQGVWKIINLHYSEIESDNK